MNLVASLLRCGIVRDWREAIGMPCDVAINLLDAMRPAENPVERKTKTETLPDGTRTMSFGSIAELRSALAGSKWTKKG